jgi:hypothetical protein
VAGFGVLRENPVLPFGHGRPVDCRRFPSKQLVRAKSRINNSSHERPVCPAIPQWMAL